MDKLRALDQEKLQKEFEKRLNSEAERIRRDIMREVVAAEDCGFLNEFEKDFYFSEENGWESRREGREIAEVFCLDYFRDGKVTTIHYSRPLGMWLFGEPEIREGVGYCPITQERNCFK